MITLLTGYGSTTSSGSITIRTFNAGNNGVSGRLSFSSGTASVGNSGSISMGSGASTNGKAGSIRVSVGAGNTGDGGGVWLFAGQSTADNKVGGMVSIRGGLSYTTTALAKGGSVEIGGGAGSGHSGGAVSMLTGHGSSTS